MPRISPERLFKSHFPNATIVRHERFGVADYLVRKNDGTMQDARVWSGNGATEVQAWASAVAYCGIKALAKVESK